LPPEISRLSAWKDFQRTSHWLIAQIRSVQRLEQALTLDLGSALRLSFGAGDIFL
jgi:hypothetical protein